MIVPFLIAGTIIYFQLSGSLIKHTRQDSVRVAQKMADSIDTYLKNVIMLASSIAANPETVEAVKTDYYHFVQKMLEAVHARIGNEYFTIFIADRNGVIRADALFPQQRGLDVSDREYFQDSRKGRASISGPIFSKGKATPGEPILVLTVPIIEDNEFLGIVGLPFNTNFIVNILAKNKSGRSGYAYLINSEGLVLVHPRSEYILSLRLLDQPGTEEMRMLIQSETDGAASCKFNGVDRIAGLAHINSADWIAVFAEDREEVMYPVKKILISISISGLIFLLITISIIIYFSGKISSPIDRNMEIMRQVTQHANEIIVQIGLDRKILFVNPAYEKLSGMKTEQLIGQDAVFNLTEKTTTPVWELLEAGTPWSGRVSLPENREGVTLEVMVVPIRNERGAIQSFLVIGRDITTELMFEKRLQQSQKLEAIGTLAGGISHDFNNILSGIFGYAELCLMKGHSASKIEKYIREILIASDRARDLVKQILTFSRQAEVELRPLSPQTTLKEALKLLRATIPATIDIQTKIECDSVIMADPTQLHQVIMNLFTNAVHAIGEKKGIIKVELEDIMVDEGFIATHPEIKPGKHIIIRISDNGVGMEPEVLEHMFEPFYTTKPQGVGAGLGLSVVHGIISSFNGIITVYSEPGAGASFNIFFPIIETGAEKLRQNDTFFLEGDGRIAFVDDEISIASSMQAILSNLGYSVTAFIDSEDALRAILEQPDNYDVIITDYTMPKLTGLELAKELKAAGIHLPIIMISGYIGRNVEEKAQEIGISFLINKPVNTYKITDAIHRCMNSEKFSG